MLKLSVFLTWFLTLEIHAMKYKTPLMMQTYLLHNSKVNKTKPKMYFAKCST